MIELYSFPTPNGQKITILLEELGFDYQIFPINITRDDQFIEEFLRISPNNRIPAIIDSTPLDGGSDISLFESGAILLYLAEKAGRFLPTDLREKNQVVEWVMWQMGNFGPMLGQAHHFRKMADVKIDYAINRYTEETARLYRVLDKRLSDRAYIVEDYSIADMSIYPWVCFKEWHGIELSDYPNVKRWFDQLSTRPLLKAGMEAGGDIWGSEPLSDDVREKIRSRFSIG